MRTDPEHVPDIATLLLGPISRGTAGEPAMKLLDAKTTVDAVKLTVFMVVTSLATGLLVITIGNVTFGESTEYKAVFSDVTGLNTGDDVRISGVRVGSVKSIDIYQRRQAMVTFDVDSDSELNQATNATIRYRNLVGQRYIALTQGAGSDTVLDEDDTIPLEPHRARPRPDRALQRVQAAVRGPLAGGRQQAVLRDHPGLPGRGRHGREPAPVDRIGDERAWPTATRSSAS